MKKDDKEFFLTRDIFRASVSIYTNRPEHTAQSAIKTAMEIWETLIGEGPSEEEVVENIPPRPMTLAEKRRKK